jgi:hypothetical protein
MPKKSEHKATAALNLRDIPMETIYRLRMAAAAEHKRSVREWIMELAEERIQELEKRGLLPKGKG